MEREKLPLKTIIKTGLLSGLFFAVTMAAFDYFTHEPFSIMKFLFHGLFFGLLMAIAFRYKYTNNNKKC